MIIHLHYNPNYIRYTLSERDIELFKTIVWMNELEEFVGDVAYNNEGKDWSAKADKILEDADKFIEDADYKLRYLKEPHIGDCVCMPCSCMRCIAENYLGVNPTKGFFDRYTLRRVIAALEANNSDPSKAIEHLKNAQPKETFEEYTSKHNWPYDRDYYEETAVRWEEERLRAIDQLEEWIEYVDKTGDLHV